VADAGAKLEQERLRKLEAMEKKQRELDAAKQGPIL
jgi:hypothetical protein